MADVQAPAIGYSIIANLGGDRQITVQHFVAAEDDDAKVNAAIDRIMRVINRQQAIGQLPELRAARDKYASELAQYEEDVGVAEASHQRALAELDVKRASLEAAAKEVFDTAYKDFMASGKQGDFKPGGSAKSAIDASKRAVAEVDNDRKKLEAEKAQFVTNIEVSIKRRQEELAKLNTQIEELEKVI